MRDRRNHQVAVLGARAHAGGDGDHVEFVGFVPHEQLPYYYSLADVFLSTGIGRGASATSLFVLECMACGTPGVRTKFTDDEIEHGASEFLYEPDDRRSLDRHLLELLTQDALRRRFGQAARRRVVEEPELGTTPDRPRKALPSTRRDRCLIARPARAPLGAKDPGTRAV